MLIVVSAPSGSGKSTILRRLLEMRENLRFSVSATTRAPRVGEEHGREYFFVSRPEFLEMVAADAFLEHAEFVENLYGTPRAAVEAQLEQGYDVYLDIDVQGASQVKAKRPETLTVFILPPSMEELERRLTGRGTDDAETIRRRLSQAERECAEQVHFDFVVVNDEVERAAAELSGIIDGYKARLAQTGNETN
ncbi:MAG: guanylate kinase [Oscillospiraceae bacterium]|nr:guanylate kinase [Oscillospiraceae bacterium]